LHCDVLLVNELGLTVGKPGVAKVSRLLHTC